MFRIHLAWLQALLTFAWLSAATAAVALSTGAEQEATFGCVAVNHFSTARTREYPRLRRKG